MPSLASFAAAMLPIAAGAILVDTTVSARAQLDSPDAMRGRVLAALGIASAASGALGGPVLGWLSDSFGPRVALQVGGVSCVAATLLAAVLLARFRKSVTSPAPARVALENA